MKKLKFGQSPFHRMTKKQLILVACRLYAALLGARSIILNDKYMDDALGRNSAFYRPTGMGGRTIEMMEQAVQAIHKEYDQEEIYRMFFRYAKDLLFESAEVPIGANWMVCPECGTMLGGRGDGSTVEGQVCKDAFPTTKRVCFGVFRKLTWEDLREVPHA